MNKRKIYKEIDIQKQRILKIRINYQEEKISNVGKFKVFNYSAKNTLVSRDADFLNSKIHLEEYQEKN